MYNPDQVNNQNAINREIVTKPHKERYYIDITTRDINTGTGVSGTNNSFTVTIQDLKLDVSKKWTAQVVAVYYRNVNLGGGVYPILLTDFVQNQRVNNNNSSLFWKSTVDATNTNYIALDAESNWSIVSPIQTNILRTMELIFERSDQGGVLFPFDPTEPVTLTILVQSVD
jgi:hypothetical protein